jgi:hypothetical protein
MAHIPALAGLGFLVANAVLGLLGVLDESSECLRALLGCWFVVPAYRGTPKSDTALAGHLKGFQSLRAYARTIVILSIPQRQERDPEGRVPPAGGRLVYKIL